MPVTLRKRLQCHGCGKRLNTAARISREGQTKIPCEGCETDNFFDQDLNPIDVPVAEATVPRYRADEAPETESTSTSFCNTCLKNQFLYITALGEYLPDEKHPDYAELEANTPAFKRELELRYPQCCAQCEPRVSSSVEHANYNAKTDHLRRIMAKCKVRQSMGRYNMRSLIIRGAGVGNVISLAVQVLWHVLAAQAILEEPVINVIDDDMSNPAPVLLSKCVRQWPMPPICATIVAPLIPWTLIVGLICIWWNPHWQQRLQGREGRLVGLRRYYLLQVVVLATRFVAWIVASDVSDSASYLQSFHAVVAVFITMLTVYAQFAAIAFDNTPLVDWAQVQRPLTHPDQFRPPVSQAFQNTPPQSQPGSQFSIHDFAGPPDTTLEPWRPPTPPDSADAMEWTSSAHNFDPRPRQPLQRFDQPTPFYGNLPAAPARGSLHPKRQPPPPPKQALGIAPGFFGLSKSQNPDQPTSNSHNQPVFAPTKFFAAERDADTGLENIFDKMFSVRDPLDQAPNKKIQQPRKTQQSVGGGRNRAQSAPTPAHTESPLPKLYALWNCTVVLALSAAAFHLTWLEYMSGGSSRNPTDLLPYTAVIPLVHMVKDGLISGPITSGQLTASIVSLLVPVCGYLFHPTATSPFAPSWNKVAIGLLTLLMLHEIYSLCQSQTRPVSTAATTQMIESMRAAESYDYEEVTATSHPSPPAAFPAQQLPPSPLLQQGWQQPPTRTVNSPQHPASSNSRDIFGGYAEVRKRGSDESISSVSSIQTTSTAAGWKTPKNESRAFDFQDSNNRFPSRRPSNNLSRGLGGLSLSNDFGIGTGFGVAGPRTTRQHDNTFGRYR